MVTSTTFSERLQIILDEYGLSAAAFAEKIAVGRATISHLLSGRNKPSLDFVLKVIRTFPEIDVYWLLDGTKKQHKTENVNDPIFPQEPIIPYTTTPETLQQQESDTGQQTTKTLKSVLLLYTDGSFTHYRPEEFKPTDIK